MPKADNDNNKYKAFMDASAINDKGPEDCRPRPRLARNGPNKFLEKAMAEKARRQALAEEQQEPPCPKP
jgi:hypothetical protein